MLIAAIVTQSRNTAQVMFVLAVVALALDILLAILGRPAGGVPVLLAVALLFVSLGLLFAF